MNGGKAVPTEIGSPGWDVRVASSNFAPNPDFSRNRFGRIMLTDHDSQVSYHNFKIFRSEAVDGSRD